MTNKIKKSLIIASLLCLFALTMLGCTPQRKLDSITIASEPTLTDYFTNAQYLILDGGVLIAHYNNGDNEQVLMTNPEVTHSGFDTQTSGQKTITLTYKQKTATFTINVQDLSPFPQFDQALPTLNSVDWSQGKNITLTDTQKQAIIFANNFYNQLNAEDKQLLSQHKTLLTKCMFALDYVNFKEDNISIFNTLSLNQITYQMATQLNLTQTLDTFNIESTYANFREIELFTINDTTTTIGDLTFELYNQSLEWNDLSTTLTNAINCFTGYEELNQSSAPYGNTILDYPQINTAYTNLTKLNQQQIDSALVYLTQWHSLYTQTMYEYFYFLNENNINCPQIQLLSQILSIDEFKMLNFQLELMISSYELMEQGFYILYVSIYEGIKITCDQIDQKYNNNEAILSFYNDFYYDTQNQQTYNSIIQEHAIEQLLFVYLLAGDLMDNPQFMDALQTLFVTISKTYTDPTYLSGTEPFDTEFKALIAQVNQLNLSLQFNFLSAQQGFYTMLLDDFYSYYLTDKEYAVYDSFMVAMYEYFYLQFGYTQDDNTFLYRMATAMYLYQNLENSTNFDQLLLPQFLIYQTYYQTLADIKDNPHYYIVITDVKNAFELVYQGYTMLALYSDSTFMLIYFPQLKAQVQSIYDSLDPQLISLFEEYSIFGSTMKLSYEEFEQMYQSVTHQFSQKSLEFSQNLVQISQQLMDKPLDGDIWDISDKSHYQGDYNSDVAQLLAQFIDLDINEKSDVICQFNIFIELIFADYLSQFLTEHEMEVFSLLLDSAYSHAIYLSSNYPDSTTLDYFIDYMTQCTTAYQNLQTTSFDTYLLTLYNFYLNLLP